MNTMSGGSSFLSVLKDEGVTHLFGNPGTTELPIMHALSEHPALEYVLGLQEAVVVAMADGFARASGQLAACNVHVAPGLGNAMGSIFNANWSGSPIIVSAGQQEQGHGLMEPMLYGELVPMAASELEYYLLRDSYRQAAERGHRDLRAVGWYREDYHILQGKREEPLHAAVRRHLRRSAVPVESTKGEWGIGQHEINLRYCPALEMADRHALTKQCLKEVADELELSVTFMAKPSTDQSGASCHMHLSLWQGGRNAFAGQGARWDPLFGPVPLVSGRLDRARA